MHANQREGQSQKDSDLGKVTRVWGERESGRWPAAKSPGNWGGGGGERERESSRWLAAKSPGGEVRAPNLGRSRERDKLNLGQNRF